MAHDLLSKRRASGEEPLSAIVKPMRLLQPDDYQPKAASLFVSARAQLQQLLPGAVIEHVGSTAVPGALSKGDLDICVLVSPGDHEVSVQVLTGYGYVEKADTLRTTQLCMLEWQKVGEEHAVQIVAEGSPFDSFIAFRDALRASPALVAEYNSVKVNTAHLSEAEYRAAKALFIERVIRDICAQ